MLFRVQAPIGALVYLAQEKRNENEELGVRLGNNKHNFFFYIEEGRQ